MSDINKKIEDIIKDLEQNLESKKDIEYVKNVFNSLKTETTNIEQKLLN